MGFQVLDGIRGLGPGFRVLGFSGIRVLGLRLYKGSRVFGAFGLRVFWGFRAQWVKAQIRYKGFNVFRGFRV